MNLFVKPVWKGWKRMNDKTLDNLTNAMFDPSFPCNPLSFLIGLTEYVRENWSDSIKDSNAQKMLWVVIAQSYGQLANVDLMNEYTKLDKERVPNV